MVRNIPVVTHGTACVQDRVVFSEKWLVMPRNRVEDRKGRQAGFITCNTHTPDASLLLFLEDGVTELPPTCITRVR